MVYNIKYMLYIYTYEHVFIDLDMLFASHVFLYFLDPQIQIDELMFSDQHELFWIIQKVI